MFFIDVQGTLIDDREQRAIPGAVEFIDLLNERGIPYLIITNNTKRASSHFLAYLRSQGFQIEEDRYIDPLMVLGEVLPPTRVAAYGVKGFLETLEEMGYKLEYGDPEAVVLSVRDDYTFQEFGEIDEYLLNGARLIGMHGTSLYVHGERRYPGVGALLAMFQFATGVGGEVVGKPSPLFYRKALEKIGGEDFSQVTIISDDLRGDLLGAKALGMETILVLSGKIRNIQELQLKPEEYPDRIYPSIGEVAKELR
ncbi:MAG: HAD-IIA family hydrolase [Epsilonproteobacteria bacterium]|nr:HAD family hydrolase [Campylobacterota bacterium]NPA57489.1 HAD-IIA family hydrolase [Campylobacterota bacterium]